MKCGRILLEMLKKYEVKHVFGLPGETTLHWYEEWKKFPDIEQSTKIGRASCRERV